MFVAVSHVRETALDSTAFILSFRSCDLTVVAAAWGGLGEERLHFKVGLEVRDKVRPRKPTRDTDLLV